MYGNTRLFAGLWRQANSKPVRNDARLIGLGSVTHSSAILAGGERFLKAVLGLVWTPMGVWRGQNISSCLCIPMSEAGVTSVNCS